MSKRLYRVGLAMPQEEYDLLTEVARARNKSRAAVIMELFREVVPTLEQVVAIARMRDQAFDAPRAVLRRATQTSTARLLELAEQAGDQMDMIVEQTIRDAVRNGHGKAPGAVRAPQARVRPGTPGKSGKRRHRAVKRRAAG